MGQVSINTMEEYREFLCGDQTVLHFDWWAHEYTHRVKLNRTIHIQTHTNEYM